MAGLLTLLSLSTVMAAASFIAGILPLTISLSKSQLRLISTIGMGVLVGTSLIVIIPEGVDTLYQSADVHQTQQTGALSNHANLVKWTHVTRSTLPDSSFPGAISAAHRQPVPGVEIGTSPSKLSTEQSTGSKINSDHDDTHHAWIGIALISGFILMFLIDKVPHYTRTAKTKTRTHHIALNNLGGPFVLTPTPAQEPEAEMFLPNDQSTESASQGHSFATTTGLVIHAAADGIALGASSSSSNTGLSLVIFFAIMVHKAPAAFGLTSILLQQGLSKRLARAHLVVFSLAAPFGALMTWIIARVLTAGTTQNPKNTNWWTGVLLLFSAGTFLYVAMHSMQEITDGHQHGSATEEPMNGFVGETRDNVMEGPEKSMFKDLGAAIFGMILPLFLQIGHAH